MLPNTRTDFTWHAMDLKSIAEVAASFAGAVSASLEIQRRIGDYKSDTRAHRLRARADELAKFLQIQTQLQSGGADQQLTQQAIASTKTELDGVLRELVRVQQGAAGATKVDEMSPARRWLLLFVPARHLAWLLHFGFYFTASFVVLCIFKFKEASASRLVPLELFVLGVTTSAVLAVFFQFWALMEKRWSEGFRPTPSPICRRLLWYRPASRRELIARFAVLFALIQFVPSISTTWVSRFMESFNYVQLVVTLVVYYAWNSAEIRLATNTVGM